MRSILFAAGLGLCLLGAGAAPGQEGSGEKGEKKKDLVQMLKAIERDMAHVEALLLKTRAGKDTSAAVQEVVKRIDRLLDQCKNRESKIIEDIEKVIDEVRKRQREQERRRQRQRPGQNQRRRRDPRNRREDPRFQNRPQRRSEDQRASRDRRQQETDRKPPSGRQRRVDHPDKAGVWGQLPPKLFDLLTSREQTVFPPEFVAFIERYYRRLAENKP